MADNVACTQCGKDYELTELLRGLCPVCLFAQAVPDVDRAPDSKEARFIPPKIRELAPHFPQLEMLELIGHGGMSAVYKARQTNLGRIVAVKLLPQEVAQSNGGLERFQQEAKTLAQLSHPNIVNVYDAGQAGPWCYIVMEYVDGPNLRRVQSHSAVACGDGFSTFADTFGVVETTVNEEVVILQLGSVSTAQGWFAFAGRRLSWEDIAWMDRRDRALSRRRRW